MARTARAALLNAPGERVSIEEITLDDPGADEVVVRIAASGVCHTDLHVKRSGGWGLPFPILLGHEGAGYVEEVGSNVSRRRAGRCGRDRVAGAVRAVRPLPARRPAAVRGAPSGEATDAPRFRRRDAGTDASNGHVHRTNDRARGAGGEAARRVPLDRACLLACGVSTGAGAPINTTPVWPGRHGRRHRLRRRRPVGVAGAKIAGAARIIAVDVAPQKLEWARHFGATDVVDASAVDAVDTVRQTDRGQGSGLRVRGDRTPGARGADGPDARVRRDRHDGRRAGRGRVGHAGPGGPEARDVREQGHAST